MAGGGVTILRNVVVVDVLVWLRDREDIWGCGRLARSWKRLGLGRGRSSPGELEIRGIVNWIIRHQFYRFTCFNHEVVKCLVTTQVGLLDRQAKFQIKVFVEIRDTLNPMNIWLYIRTSISKLTN